MHNLGISMVDLGLKGGGKRQLLQPGRKDSCRDGCLEGSFELRLKLKSSLRQPKREPREQIFLSLI